MAKKNLLKAAREAILGKDQAYGFDPGDYDNPDDYPPPGSHNDLADLDRIVDSVLARIGKGVTQFKKDVPQGLGDAGRLMQAGVERIKSSPAVRVGTEPVGLALGAASGLIGGAVGAAGTPIKNLIQGRPLGQDLGRNVRETASKTAKFGYNVGKEGAFIAPVTAVGGSLGSAGLTASGVGTGVEKLGKGDYAGAGMDLGTAALGAYGAARQPNLTPGGVLDKQVKGLLGKVREVPGKIAGGVDRFFKQPNVTLGMSIKDVMSRFDFSKPWSKLSPAEKLAFEKAYNPSGKVGRNGEVSDPRSMWERMPQYLKQAKEVGPRPGKYYPDDDTPALDAKIHAEEQGLLSKLEKETSPKFSKSELKGQGKIVNGASKLKGSDIQEIFPTNLTGGLPFSQQRDITSGLTRAMNTNAGSDWENLGITIKHYYRGSIPPEVSSRLDLIKKMVGKNWPMSNYGKPDYGSVRWAAFEDILKQLGKR